MKHVMLFTAIGMLFPRCSKLMDYYYKHQPGHEQPGVTCRIDSIYLTSPSLYSAAAGVHYNEKGNPATIYYSLYDEFPVNFTIHYEYDEKGRLVYQVPDFIYAGPKEVKYAYEGDSKLPVRDTIFQLYAKEIEHFYYDRLGRIIRIAKHTIPYFEQDSAAYPDTEARYYYDVWGNRQEHPGNAGYNGLIEYTSGPSLYSLHPVWQIVHKNFSRNSVPGAEVYNEQGLPLKIKEDDSTHYQPFLDIDLRGYKLEYDCSD